MSIVNAKNALLGVLRKSKGALIGVLLVAGTSASYAQLPAHCTHGQYTCRTGFVWREATPGDYRCVSPQTRAATRNENRLHRSRVMPNGYCRQGFVWREATAGDRVCVTPASRDRARHDNSLGWRNTHGSCLIQ